jgi:hypothetical protein
MKAGDPLAKFTPDESCFDLVLDILSEAKSLRPLRRDASLEL